MAGRNNDSPQEAKHDKHEQVGFQDAERGAHEAFVGQYLKGDNNVAQNVGDTQQKFGVSKDGQFNYASPEQLAAMDDKTLMAYVKAHDDYTQQQIAAHPEKLQKIAASYGTRLDDDLTKQTFYGIQDFYDKMLRATKA